jgi:hypothetical protein
MNGWKPMKTMLIVNWCGHGQQFIPWRDADGYWTLVPIIWRGGVTVVPGRVPHQLLIHLDYPPEPGPLEIRYSYPFSTSREVRETVIRLAG